MSSSSAEEPALPRLPIWDTVKAGYRQTYRHRGALVTAATLPVLLSTLLAAILADLPEESLISYVSSFSDAVIVVLFELAWYRWLLLRSAEAAPRLLPRPGRRFLPYLGYSWLLGLVMAPAFIAPEFVGEGDMAPLLTGAVFLPLFVIGLYIVVRCTLIFPWIAVDAPERVIESWQVTRGNGLRLFLVFAITAAPVFLLAIFAVVLGVILVPDAIEQIELAQPANWHFWSVQLVSQICFYLIYGLTAAAFAQAFSTLTGWTLDRDEILERFE